ncbi:hypothetical protein KP509_32G067800 [Ceratopteris richardii]|nr:hypothetical protein KP509_32G067800 [Ceratopteris richardii]
MQAENISPDDVTFIFALKLCSSVRSIRESQLLHADIVGRGLESKTFIGNALVDVYAKCGTHKEAHSLLFSLHTRDVVSWNALMSGYGENGCGEEVLSCLKEMEQDGILPDKTSVICGLKACGLVQKLGKGREIHLAIAKVGLDQELHVSNTLVVMYVKCGSLVDANKLVLSASKHDLVAWTVLIAGHIEKGMNIEALKCFEKMKQQGVSPDSNAYVFCLQACCDMKSVGQGQLVYLEIVKRGLNLNIFIGSALVHMYTKFGLLVDAHDVLQCLPIRNEVCWTALVSGYVEHGLCREALDCFKKMQAENISPVEFTYACILKACGILGSFEEGQYIHLDVVRKGFEVEAYVGNALVDMYVKVGHLYEAKSVFDKLPYLNVVAWTALISGYAEGELHEQVLDCFGQMQAKNINADAVILILCLKACGATISLERGREVHAEVRKSGLENDLFLANSLIDMYGKCGSPEEGQEVFNRMSVRDIVSWNALITAYGENHEGKMALQSFKRMQEQGFEPDIATFTCLLIACSHSSLIEDGQKCFELMVEKYGYEPIPQHYSTMVDLFARAGEVVKAWRFVEAMQSPPSKELLTALLTSCKNYGEGEVGERCFDLLVQLYPEDGAMGHHMY